MSPEIRFGDYQRELAIERDIISYNHLSPKLDRDAEGKLIPYVHPKLTLSAKDVYRLIFTYTRGRFLDQFKAVAPLAVYLAMFQFFILDQEVSGSWGITAGLLAVMLGLMFFMEGLQLGLMPFGEIIGNKLPQKSPLPVVLLIAFLLGIGVTFAEPAIGALKAAGAIVRVESAPLLFAILNEWAGTLVLVVGIGVGLAAVLGTLRFLYGWSLKPLIYMALTPVLGLTILSKIDPELEKIVGLAWDCGAVTTGPVTVPLVLALGIGIASSAGKGDSSLSGFGIVTLASLFPILGALGLAFFVSMTTTPDEIIAGAHAAAAAAAAATVEPPWYETTPGVEIIGGVRAILPLVLFLFVVLRFLLREPVRQGGLLAYGITLTILGMVIFNLGLTYGLAELGGQTGGLVPGAFHAIEELPHSPIYIYAIGLFLALLFAWALGFGATLAEPALNALGMTVENLTHGVFKKSLLMYAVSLGVAFGLALGLIKIIFNVPLMWLLVPLYLLGVVLTHFSTEEFVNIAWDSAGVTTGPITVPLVLAMGLAFGNAMQAVEGFGILSMASICPILSVLTTGIWVRFRANRAHKEESHDLPQGASAG